MSKGSRPRPVNQAKYKANFDRIKWTNTPKYVNRKPEPRKEVHHIMPDIEPYRAVAGDQRVITSRSKEREFLKQHNCIQVGNEKEHFFKHNGKTEDNPTKDW